jgi:thymidylate synthase (FAD)
MSILETLEVEMYDFSQANLNNENRIKAITLVASVCYQNPKALNNASLYNRLMAESIGLPSSSFEFVPVLLDPKREPDAMILGNIKTNVRKFGEWIRATNDEGYEQDFLLTNYRALVYDCEERCAYFTEPEVLDEIRSNYLELFNNEFECNIIKQHFKVFKYNVDIVTRAQMVRHRVNWQELSRRYVSGKRVPFDFYISEKMKDVVSAYGSTEDIIEICVNHYYDALDKGIKPEEARRIIPQGMQTTIWGAFQPRQLENFYKLRLDSKAQTEIKAIATAMLTLEEKGEYYGHNN